MKSIETIRGCAQRAEQQTSRDAGSPNLSACDPLVFDIIGREALRQEEKIILIASESRPHPAVLEALASPFTSVYAEGYSPRRHREASLADLSRIEERLREYAELGNDRYYRGTEFADLIEGIAERRTAERFCTPEYPSEGIHVNVQPLSGSAANLAAYEALLDPGDRMMSMALTEGGHLTHGSPYSVAGRRYEAVFYRTDPATGRLDYDAIERLAVESKPSLLVGGFTSYPWYPDWIRLRSIADLVGARLLADISHTAGMVAGGVFPSPVGIADVVTCTTHKTLCGPRGAVVLSTDPEIARRIDRAVFPGLQGGPHMNKIAAIAVAMELARSDEFRTLQHRIVSNAKELSSSLTDNGIRVAYGGTDTHLVLVDLRDLGIQGETAARALDQIGVVCNRNVIPGDRNGKDVHGIRLGTTWVSQLGWGAGEMDELAGIIADVLKQISDSFGGGLPDRPKLGWESAWVGAKSRVRQLIDR